MDWVKPLFCEIYNIFMEIKKILVALDGSKNSQRALEMAIVLAKRPKDKTFSTKAKKQILSPRTILGVYVKPWLQ